MGSSLRCVERSMTKGTGSADPADASKSLNPWLTDEVLSTTNTMTIEELIEIGLCSKEDYSIRLPKSGESIFCSRARKDNPYFFFFYEDCISQLGIRFLFTKFQINLLNHLHLAPSQIHPKG